MLTEIERLRLLSRLFTRPLLKELAVSGDWKQGLSFLTKPKILREGSPRTLASLFDNSWDCLRRRYRNEYIYKNEIANRIIFGRHSPRTASLHIELPVGKSIVDVAIFNGASTAYEVKTEFDSAKRLKSQTSDYRKVFERVFVVTHPQQAYRYLDHVPAGVGIYALSSGGTLTLVRDAQHSANSLDVDFMFRCLRQEEYRKIAEEISGQVISLPNGLLREHCYSIFSEMAKEDVSYRFLAAMKGRTLKPGFHDFLSLLPKSLRALGYATPLSGTQQVRLLDLLDRPIPLTLDAL